MTVMRAQDTGTANEACEYNHITIFTTINIAINVNININIRIKRKLGNTQANQSVESIGPSSPHFGRCFNT